MSSTSNIPEFRKHAGLQMLSDFINYHWKLFVAQIFNKYSEDALVGYVPVSPLDNNDLDIGMTVFVSIYTFIIFLITEIGIIFRRPIKQSLMNQT